LLGDGQSAPARDGLARACWWLGDLRSAVEHGERAFALYQQEGWFAEAAMVGIHRCVWFLANYDNATAAGSWLSRAQHLAARSGDPVVMGWTDLVSGYLAEEQDEGRRRLERAAAAAENTADVDLATMSLADLGLWHVTAGEVDQGVAMLDEAMAATLAEPRGMLEVVVWSSCNMLAACSLLDDLKRATDWCRAADRFMETYGCPFLQARCRSHYGRLLVATGRWGEAEAELDRALAMIADTGRGPRTEALTALAELRLRRGEPEAALRLLEDADPTPWGAATQAACLSATSRAEEARLLLHGQVAVHDPKDPAYPALVAALAETSLATGRTEEATLLVAPDAAACTAQPRRSPEGPVCSPAPPAWSRPPGRPRHRARPTGLRARGVLTTRTPVRGGAYQTRRRWTAGDLRSGGGDRPRGVGAQTPRGVGSPPGGRPGRCVPPFARRHSATRTQVDRSTVISGTRCPSTAVTGVEQSRDRRTPLPEPPHGPPARQQHPAQARCAFTVRGSCLRSTDSGLAMTWRHHARHQSSPAR
jgi:tetratricopeptide (TPR) repeat protein